MSKNARCSRCGDTSYTDFMNSITKGRPYTTDSEGYIISVAGKPFLCSKCRKKIKSENHGQTIIKKIQDLKV